LQPRLLVARPSTHASAVQQEAVVGVPLSWARAPAWDLVMVSSLATKYTTPFLIRLAGIIRLLEERLALREATTVIPVSVLLHMKGRHHLIIIRCLIASMELTSITAHAGLQMQSHLFGDAM